MSVALFTNNDRLLQKLEGLSPALCALPGARALALVNSGPGSAQDSTSVLFNADAGGVLATARDLVHVGWRLMHHPLYGNYRPNQQPYRSILLSSPPVCPATDASLVDAYSLRLIEEALLIYANYPALHPKNAPFALKEACSIIDYELMLLPLEQCGAFRFLKEQVQ